MVQQYSQPYYLAKYMKLYRAVCCCIEYGRAAPSCGLLIYEKFSTALKPIMTKVAEISARWRCKHTFPNSGRMTFGRFLAQMTLFWMVSAISAIMFETSIKFKVAHWPWLIWTNWFYGPGYPQSQVQGPRTKVKGQQQSVTVSSMSYNQLESAAVSIVPFSLPTKRHKL